MGRAGAPLGARGVGAGVAHAAGASLAALYDSLGRSACDSFVSRVRGRTATYNFVNLFLKKVFINKYSCVIKLCVRHWFNRFS